MTSLINYETDDTEEDKPSVDHQILEYLQTVKKIKAGQIEVPKVTPYRISTISAKCRLTGEINIQELYLLMRKQIEEKIMKQKEPDYFVQGIQYGENIVGLFKNLQKKLDKIQAKLNDEDYKNIDFYNQCTLLLYSDYNNNQINLKVFRNGSITMTGCKDENDGTYVIQKLIGELKKHSQIFMYDEDQNDISMEGFGITMINSDYFIGFRLDLIKLEEVLANKYGLFFSYDPKVYAAVKISFMWNKESDIHNGICQCEKKCIVSKKKSIKSKNKCSIITIAVFNSGKIIITGSNTIEKTRAAYKFINQLLRESYANIVKLSIHDCVKVYDKKKIRKGRPPKKDSILIEKPLLAAD